MNFWEFANEHPIVTLLCVLGLGSCAASCVKSISQGFGWNSSGKKIGKLEIKTPRVDGKNAEKAH